MAELDYFAANAPVSFRSRKGRLVGVGVVLLLTGGLLTYIGGFGLFQVVSRIHAYDRILPQLVVTITLTAAGLWLSVSGIGCVARYRWSRLVALIAVNAWLTFTGCTLAVTFAVEIARGVRSGLLSGEWYFPYLMPVLVGVVLALGPAVLIALLLRPNDVRLTLEYADSRSRWTDGIRVLRLGASVCLLLLGPVWFVVLAEAGDSWPITDAGPRVASYTAMATILAGAAAGAAGRGRVTGIAAVALCGVSVALLGYVGWMANRYTTFSFAYNCTQIGNAIAVLTVCGMQLARDVRTENPYDLPMDDIAS